MKSEFEMTDVGEFSYFLGMEFIHTDLEVVMHQRKYTRELLERFNMNHCNSVKSPLEVNVKLKIDEAKAAVNETVYK